MANRLVNRFYIIDSQMGAATPLLGANTASWLDDSLVNAISFWGANTTGVVEYVLASNTADSFCVLTAGNNASAGSWSSTQFATPQLVSELRVKTLTAGTSWIYLA